MLDRGVFRPLDLAAVALIDHIEAPSTGSRDGHRHGQHDETLVTPAHHTIPLCGAVERNGTPKNVKNARTKTPAIMAAPRAARSRFCGCQCR